MRLMRKQEGKKDAGMISLTAALSKSDRERKLSRMAAVPTGLSSTPLYSVPHPHALTPVTARPAGQPATLQAPVLINRKQRTSSYSQANREEWKNETCFCTFFSRFQYKWVFFF